MVGIVVFSMMCSTESQAKSDVLKAESDVLVAKKTTIDQHLRFAVQTKRPGARRFLWGKSLRPLKVSDVLLLTKQQNLTLALQNLQVEQAGYAIDQADSLFNPEFYLSLNYARSNSRERVESITRLRELVVQEGDWLDTDTYGTDDTEDDAQWWWKRADDETNDDNAYELYEAYIVDELESTLDYGHDTDPVHQLKQVEADDERLGQTLLDAGLQNTCVMLSGEAVGNSCSDAQFRTEVRTEEEYASYWSDWSESWGGSVGVSDYLSWGGSVSASLSSNLYPYDATKSVSLGLKTATNLGEREWVSGLSSSFYTPLPWTKNFGNEGFRPAVDLNQARLAKLKSQWSQSSQLNLQIAEALTNYWEVVRAGLQVESSTLYRKTLEERLEQVLKQFKLHRVTEYDKMQAEAALENALNTEEIAWNTYVSRSNTLAEILNLPDVMVPVPSDYDKELGNVPDIKPAAAMELALKNHPHIQSERVSLHLADTEINYRKNQLLPDVNFLLSLSLGESKSIFGYRSWGSSMKGLTDPDSLNYSFGLTFSYPFGNESVKSNYASSLADRDWARDSLMLSEMSVVQKINTSLASNLSTRRRVALASQELSLSQQAFARAQRLRKIGRLSEFELLERNNDLFNARVTHINALIDQRLQWVKLQAAEGILGLSAQNPAKTSGGEGS